MSETRGGNSDWASIEKLAESFLERFRRGERPTISEYAEKHPECADQIRELFPALLFLEECSLRGKTESFGGSAAGAKPLEQLGEYRILREVGRGGMGVVYEAEQVSLGRHVALKVLPKHALLSERQLERFRQEARAAARLEHPNIVPVYGIGEEEGIHYYVMQFIAGQPLDQVLLEIKRRRGSGDRGSSSSLLTGAQDAAPSSDIEYFRNVARVCLQVADALSYAHDQGIVHRDVKPSNLLLDPRGTVWVTDFGLAKAEGSEDLTHSGEIVGTLRYMAPERFRGWSDPRSDIYGLGLTLYELLTLDPAFPHEDRARLIKTVTEEEPPRPRRADPHIPRDLETIVLASIAREPGERYPTAKDLAADLKRFLAGEPIGARRASALERGVKWAKRRPAQAALIAVSVLAVLIVLVGSLWYNRRLAVAVQDSQRQGTRAEKNYGKARDAVDKLLARVGEESLLNVPQMEKVRQELLEQALAFYKGFLEEKSSDPAVRFETARSYLRVADIYNLLGKHTEADDAYRQAIAHSEALTREYPEAVEYVKELALERGNLAEMLKKTGRFDEAEAAFRDALAALETLSDRFPGDLDCQDRLAGVHHNLGLMLERLDSPEAEPHLLKAVEILERLVAGAESRRDLKARLGNCYGSVGEIHRIKGRIEESEEGQRKSLEIFLQLHEESPGDRELTSSLATDWNKMAMLFHETGRHLEAVDASNKAIELFRKLAAEFRFIPEYREWLAGTQVNLAKILAVLGKYREAEQTYLETIPIEEELMQEHDDVPMYKLVLAQTHANLAAALALWTISRDAARFDDAEKHARRALEVLALASAKGFESPEILDSEATAQANLGSIMVRTERLEEAGAAFQRAVTLIRKILDRAPDQAEYRAQLCTVLGNLSTLELKRGEPAKARAFCAESLEEQRWFLVENPRDPSFLECRMNTCKNLSNAWLLEGNHTEAAAAARLLVGDHLQGGEPLATAEACQNAAEILGNCFVAAAKDEKLDAESRTARCAEYAKKVESVLRKARECLQGMIDRSENASAARNELGMVLGGLAEAKWMAHEFEEARHLYVEAMPILKAARDSDPESTRYAEGMSAHLMGLARTLIDLGDHEAAADTARRLRAEYPQSAVDAYNAAGLFSRCLPLLEKDAGIAGDQREVRIRERATEAMTALRESIALGYRDADAARKDEDLAPLRRFSPEEFDKLIDSMESQSPALQAGTPGSP